MAKATANCMCKTCGAEFTRTKTCYNRREADSWENWAESNFTLCPQCWGKEQQAKREAEPIIINMAINPHDDTKPFILYFSGGTRPRKDEIKALGYRWGELPVVGFFGAFSTSRPPMAWHKTVSYPDLEAEVKKAEASGLPEKLVIKISDLELAALKPGLAPVAGSRRKGGDHFEN